jgi:hypothetical protein
MEKPNPALMLATQGIPLGETPVKGRSQPKPSRQQRRAFQRKNANDADRTMREQLALLERQQVAVRERDELIGRLRNANVELLERAHVAELRVAELEREVAQARGSVRYFAEKYGETLPELEGELAAARGERAPGEVLERQAVPT